ncbi:MAG: hypothetical protein ACRDZR_00005 [Acidimicrobiales bacterium]
MPDIESLADPIREVHGHVDTLVRLGAASGVQVADRALQRRLEVERAERRALEDEARQATERERAQRELARLIWRRAFDDAWWDQATEEQIARSYEAAFVYAGTVPDAADALVRLDQEIERRHLLGADEGDTSRAGDHEPNRAGDEPSAEVDEPDMTAGRVRDLLARMRADSGLPPSEPATRAAGGSALVNEDEVATTMAASFAAGVEVGVER